MRSTDTMASDFMRRARAELTSDDCVWWLWGKAQADPRDEGPAWHPLICHMIDVMSVADAMLDRLPGAALNVLTSPFGDLRRARPWLRLVVGLHDMGKATPGFQLKWPGILEEQERRGLPNRRQKERYRHGISGTAIASGLLMNKELLGELALSDTTAVGLARAVASHHGEFARDEAVEECREETLPVELRDGGWRAAHLRLARTLFEVARGSDDIASISSAPELNPGFVLALTGLTSVADWLGSDTSVFRYQALPVTLDEYCLSSAARALEILDRVGWRSPLVGQPRAFGELFDFAPRSLQVQMASVVERVTAPSLLIVESTMGDGKTEAALLVSEALAPRIGQAGLYIGLPTQATSNQMLGRVQKFLERNSIGPANLQLVHGDAFLSEQFAELKLRSIHGDDSVPNVAAEQWFARSKHSLLASHAVGTIDQGLTGVLQTRHAFVRLFGLAGKTVVLDEVHAYDTYTSELLDRLVSWLSVLGATVVILSATLPSGRRRALIEAYGAQPAPTDARYPRITAATRGAPAFSVTTEASRPAQTITLEQREDDFGALARQIAKAIASGGCVAWICNTVGRAQSAYDSLRRLRAERLLAEDASLGLLHSRFLRKDRQQRERLAEQLYGRESTARPHRGVLVGTQVLEQSLDLDFDLMVTDLAPIDLILQRVGRVHRHDRARPAAHAAPRLWIVQPETAEGRPTFRTLAPMYSEDVMLRTWWELQSATNFAIPSELEMWVERIYGALRRPPEDPELATHLKVVEETAREEQRSDWAKAQSKLLFFPDAATREDTFGNVYTVLIEDETGDVSPELRAQTRLGDPSTDVVCLWQTERGLCLAADGTEFVDLEKPASLTMARRLMQHSLKLENRKLRRLCDLAFEPPAWRQQSMLRGKKVLPLGNEAAAKGYVLDQELGLVTDSARSDR